MFKYMIGKLPLSFNGMFITLAEPNRTKSYKLELVNNKYLESFPTVFLPSFLEEYSNFCCINRNCFSC